MLLMHEFHTRKYLCPDKKMITVKDMRKDWDVVGEEQ
jgi:hypothetical protein